MSKKTYEIGDLRDKLFAQLERLDDPNCDIDKELKKSEAYVAIGNVIVNSAKAEVDYMRVVGGKKGSGFIGAGKQLGNGEKKENDE